MVLKELYAINDNAPEPLQINILFLELEVSENVIAGLSMWSVDFRAESVRDKGISPIFDWKLIRIVHNSKSRRGIQKTKTLQNFEAAVLKITENKCWEMFCPSIQNFKYFRCIQILFAELGFFIFVKWKIAPQ